MIYHNKLAYDTAPAWAPLIAQWKVEQAELAGKVVIAPLSPLPRFVAGADCAYTADDRIVAAAVVYDRQEKKIVEIADTVRAVDVPYIPGYLSFREGAAIREAIGKLKHAFGAILFDGAGIAHPRRCGIGAHLAVTLDVPGVGVAKTRLCGTHAEPAPAAGASEALMLDGEEIGAVLRTRENVKPLYVSVAHRCDISSAKALVLVCCNGFRLPEPTRVADREVARLRKELSGESNVKVP